MPEIAASAPEPLTDRSLVREWRAKYTSDELKEAAKSGSAMSDESYPIKDADDLAKAIKAVGRGNADHDSIRKHIIARAKALKLSSQIPDNWESDGSLKEEKSVWSTVEERETFNDRRQLVESAISDSLPKAKKGEYVYGPYVMDMDEDMAVYEYQGDYWQVDYTISDGDQVELQDPVKVRKVTSYEKLSRRGRRAVENSTEDMEECPTCSGEGTIKNGTTECPDCNGTGEIEKGSRAGKRALELRQRRVEDLRASKSEERRSFSVRECEFRDASEDDDGMMHFEGYASLVETPYSVGDFTEPLALDTPVATPDGWSTVGALDVGDSVFGSDGQPCRISHLTEVFTDRLCYRIRFNDGQEITTSAEHGWTLDRLRSGRGVWETVTTTTEQMAADYLFGKREMRRYRIPTVAIEMPEAKLEVDPYLLGLWLGDGAVGTHWIAIEWDKREAIEAALADALAPWETMTCVQTSDNGGILRVLLKEGVCGRGHVRARTKVMATGRTPGPEARDYCRQCRRDRKHGIDRGSQRLVARLREIGIEREKHIPMTYLRASRTQREALLQGLMDSDGSIKRTGNAVFTNTNKRLLDGFCELLTSLGHMWHRASYERRKDGGTFEDVTFTPATDTPIARLPHKAARQHAASLYARYRRVVAIERVATVPVRCIGIDTADHLFQAGAGVLTHNTIQRGAFKRTLREDPDVVFRVEHRGLPLARTERPHSDVAGTLQLEETQRGLLVKATFDPEDTDAQQLKLKMDRGLVDEMSFAFRCTDDEWNSDWTDRKVKSVNLGGGDVSAVTFGASPTTASTTSIRSTDGELEIRAGKALSAAKEKQIQTLIDKLAEAGDDLSGLLPSEPDPDPVSLWGGLERKAADDSELLARVKELRELLGDDDDDDPDPGGGAAAVPAEPAPSGRSGGGAAALDYTTRAAQELELLALRGSR